MKDVGKALRKMREAAGQTQKDVADLLGLGTGQFVSNFERGKSLPPDYTLWEMAGLYGVPYEDLVNLIYSAKIARLKERRKALLEDAS